MATSTLVAASPVVANGSTGAGDISATPALPTGTAVGDRVFLFGVGRNTVSVGAGWTQITSGTLGGGSYAAGTGPRNFSVQYRDYDGVWTMPAITSAGFPGIQNGIAVSAWTVRADTGYTLLAPGIAAVGNDTTADTGYSAVASFGIAADTSALVMLATGFPGTTTTASPTATATGMTAGTITNIVPSAGTAVGDQLAQTVHTFSPSGSTTSAITHNLTLGTARTGGTVFLVQLAGKTYSPTAADTAAALDSNAWATRFDSLQVERVAAYENRFDPRSGTTGHWMGGDVATSVPLGDSQNRVLWLFADTFWRNSLTPNPPVDRLGWTMTNQSIAVQTGLDLATAGVQFYSGGGSQAAGGGGGNWFTPPDGVHAFWPHSAVMIGNDLYITAIRTVKSNPYATEAGWAVGKIPNVKETAPSTWVGSIIYESGDTNVRPIVSPYVGGDGYIYAFVLQKGNGYYHARWTVANFTGSGTQSNIEYSTGTGWTTSFGSAKRMYENILTAEASVHQRPSDGRWVLVDTTLPGANAGRGMLNVSDMENGAFPPNPATGYHAPGPQLMPGDRFTDQGGFTGFVVAVLPSGDRVIRYDDVWGGAVQTAAVATLTSQSNSTRYFYSHPKGETDTHPSYQVYSWRSHPELGNAGGLITTYCDNKATGLGSPNGADYELDIYWPKFVRILPPTVTNLAVTGGGVASWSASGAPDRQFYRLNGGAWVEIDPTARTVTIPGYANQAVEVMVRGVGGEAAQTVTPAQTATPALVTAAFGTLNPTVSMAITIAPDLVAATPATYAPTVSPVTTAVPNLVAVTPATYGPVVAMDMTLVPDLVADVSATYGPVVTMDMTLVPDLVAGGVDTYPPSIGAESTVSPSPLDAPPAAVHAPSIDAVLAAWPDHVASAPQLYAPSASSEITVAPAPLIVSPLVHEPSLARELIIAQPDTLARAPELYYPRAVGALLQNGSQVIRMPVLTSAPVVHQLDYPGFDIRIWDGDQWVEHEALQWDGGFWIPVEPVSSS